jgi:hypothetical protein
MSQRKMPVEFCPFVAIIMGKKLGHERGLFSEVDEVLEPEIQPVFRPKKVIITGKSGRVKKIGEEFTMKEESFFFKKRPLFQVGPVNKNFIGIT